MVMVNQIIHLGVGIENSQTLVCSRAINEFNSFIAGTQHGGSLSAEEEGLAI